MGTFPSLSRSERAPHKITTAVVRAQDQFLSTVDAVVTSPDLPTPSGGLIAGGRDRSPVRRAHRGDARQIARRTGGLGQRLKAWFRVRNRTDSNKRRSYIEGRELSGLEIQMKKPSTKPADRTALSGPPA